MQQSTKALIGLVCALKGIDPSTVESIQVENPITITDLQKETTMDLKLTLNTNEILNIELQMYFDKYWNGRSILYLCRAFDCLKEGEDYSKLKVTTHYCITDQNLFPGNTKFYSEYYMMDTVDHEKYTDKISIGVVQLNQIENATQKDHDNNLVYWAKLINASTWEEFKALADGSPAIEEVGDLMLQMNVDSEKREALEAQRRYREQYASQYTAGYTDAEEKYIPIIAEKDTTISEQNVTISEQNDKISQMDATIAQQNDLIQQYRDKFGDL